VSEIAGWDERARAGAGHAGGADLNDVPEQLRGPVEAALVAAGVWDGHLAVEIVGEYPILADDPLKGLQTSLKLACAEVRRQLQFHILKSYPHETSTCRRKRDIGEAVANGDRIYKVDRARRRAASRNRAQTLGTEKTIGDQTRSP